jgi:hypothetical protein
MSRLGSFDERDAFVEDRVRLPDSTSTWWPRSTRALVR